MHSRTIALTAFFVMLNCTPASADEPRTPLSLMDAVKVALQHNPGYLASGSDVEAARARVRAARGLVGPTFTISDTYGLVDPVATLQTPSGGLPFAPNSTNIPVATLGYTLADGGRTAARISQADAYFAASQAVRRAAASSTVGRVCAAYFDLAAALGSANVAERSVTVSGQHVVLVQERLSSGIAARADLLQAQTQLADARVRAIDARNAVDRTSEALDAAMGVSLDDRYVPSANLDTAATPPSLATMLKIAHDNRGELAAAQDAIAAARAALSAAKADRAPRIGVSASDGNVQPAIEPGFHNQFSFGLQAVWTVFDNGVTAANVAQAESAIQHATMDADRLQTSVDLDVRQAYDDVQASAQRVAAAHALSGFAAENLRLAEIRYRGGVGTILELRDAQLQDTSAQQTLISSQAGLQRNFAALRVAAGLVQEQR